VLNLGAVEALVVLSAASDEPVGDGLVNDEEDTTARAETEHLGDVALPECAGPLVAEHLKDGSPGPWGSVGGVLEARLDDIEGSVEGGGQGSGDGTDHEVSQHEELALLPITLSRRGSVDVVDHTEIGGVPDSITPEGGLEALVEGEGTLIAENLYHSVTGVRVTGGIRAILHANLHQLEGDDHNGLSHTGTRTGCGSASVGQLSVGSSEHRLERVVLQEQENDRTLC